MLHIEKKTFSWNRNRKMNKWLKYFLSLKFWHKNNRLFGSFCFYFQICHTNFFDKVWTMKQYIFMVCCTSLYNKIHWTHNFNLITSIFHVIMRKWSIFIISNQIMRNSDILIIFRSITCFSYILIILLTRSLELVRTMADYF